ncbi:SPOR domain-containing protein [Tepidiphilus thermophilus]|uniref:Sporulation related domain n=2 Tax=Tepidiphilus TaxID=203470 RepID=A0A0K6IVG1_9PROT|nr:SPOR domain-containing protein [Tepidiphilus thermophilus]CUB07332.1 Sporulation related domain [Tepidiphilus thermophilus]
MKAGKGTSTPFPWKRVAPASVLAAVAAFALWYLANEQKAPKPAPPVAVPVVAAKVSARVAPVSPEQPSGNASASPEQTRPEPAAPERATAEHTERISPGNDLRGAETLHGEASAPAPSAEMPEKSPFAMRSKPLDKGYYVPVGVFGRLDAAERLAGQLDALGFPARLQSRVLVGPYATRQEAQQVAERLKRQHKLGAAGVMQVK